MCLSQNITGQEEVLKKLVSHSSAFEEADQQGWLPVHEAASQLNMNILEITFKGMESSWFSTKKYYKARSVEGFSFRRVLLFCISASRAATWEQTTLKGETPLLVAVRNCFVENVRFLLFNGCNPNVKNEEGDSPLVVGEYLVWGEEMRELSEIIVTCFRLQFAFFDLCSI